MSSEAKQQRANSFNLWLPLYVLAGGYCACCGVAQQQARFDADRSYNAAVNRSYDAATPEPYVPSRQPLVSAGAEAALARETAASVSALRARQLEGQARRSAAAASPLSAQWPGSGRYAVLRSSSRSAIYGGSLDHNVVPTSPRGSSSVRTATPYAALRTSPPRQTISPQRARSLNEPSFGRHRDGLSAAAARDNSPAH